MAWSSPQTPTTVLIVEDEAILRLELTSRLTDMGLIVLSADSADEAIAVLDAHREVKVMFTDIKMPGTMDGVRLAHHTRRRWPPIKIIVASGLAGIDPTTLPDDSVFLAKPYPPEDLARALGKFVPGRRPRMAAGRQQARA
jgi:two-component system, response regulator PdtaR